MESMWSTFFTVSFLDRCRGGESGDTGEVAPEDKVLRLLQGFWCLGACNGQFRSINVGELSLSAIGSQSLWSANHPKEGRAKHFVGCLEMSGEL